MQARLDALEGEAAAARDGLAGRDAELASLREQLAPPRGGARPVPPAGRAPRARARRGPRRSTSARRSSPRPAARSTSATASSRGPARRSSSAAARRPNPAGSSPSARRSSPRPAAGLARKEEERDEAGGLLRAREGDLAAMGAERDRLEAERATLLTTLEASRQGLLAMGDPATRPRESGAVELEALVRAIEGERTQWEEERASWKGRWEEERAEASRRAEARALEERGRAEAEAEDGRRRVDEMNRSSTRSARSSARRRSSSAGRSSPSGRSATRMKALINSLTPERERITAYRDQLQATFRQGEEALQARVAELARQHAQALRDKELAIRRGDEMAGQIRELRAHLERPEAARAQAPPPRRRGPRSRRAPTPRGPRTTRAMPATSPSASSAWRWPPSGGTAGSPAKAPQAHSGIGSRGSSDPGARARARARGRGSDRIGTSPRPPPLPRGAGGGPGPHRPDAWSPPGGLPPYETSIETSGPIL